MFVSNKKTETVKRGFILRKEEESDYWTRLNEVQVLLGKKLLLCEYNFRNFL